MPLIRSKDVELFYDLTGPEDAPVVAFSNSIGTTLEMWDQQVPALSDRYRCLRYDTRGHGRSPVRRRAGHDRGPGRRPRGRSRRTRDRQSSHRRPVAWRHDGASLRRAPSERAESLVLMATSAYLPHGWDERAATVRSNGMGAIVDAVLARWFTPDFAARAPKRSRRCATAFLANNPQGYAACCEAIRDMDLRARIAALTQPTLIVAGADDPATPVAMMEDIRTRMPQG